ncbi:MAG: hypothetical protein Q7R52_03110 [archaeon]|nr:hypothetical protein [archaeon]
METKEKTRYIALYEKDVKKAIEKLKTKNLEVGRRRFTIPGLFKHLLNSRYNTNINDFLNSASDEEIQKYVESKTK